MFEQTPVRKTIILELDVMVTDENEDYLEAEITHPKLSGGLYLTVNSRKELEEEFTKIDLTGEEAEVKPVKEASPVFSFSTPTPASVQPAPKPSLSFQLPVPASANSVESLIKNTFNLASGLMQMRNKLKK